MCSFEIFFINSILLQRFKFFRNMWGEVKLLHFNKVTFSVEKLLKGVYSLQILSRNFSTDFGRTIFEKTPSRIILQRKLSIYYYSFIFNRTSWLLNKSNQTFFNYDLLLESFGEASGLPSGSLDWRGFL